MLLSWDKTEQYILFLISENKKLLEMKSMIEMELNRKV